MKISGGTGVVLFGTATAAYQLNKIADRSILTVEHALQRLEVLKGKQLVSTGSWQPAKVFIHCAKSIAFSLSEFPQHRSQFFKNWVGANAFSVFHGMGKMSHNLSEAIPGEESLKLTSSESITSEAAILVLQQQLQSLVDFQGDLAEHFAYGMLSREEYQVAQVMHIYNHLEEIQVSPQ